MNIQQRAWKVGVAVGVLLAIFLAIVSIKAIKEIKYVGKNNPIMNAISVNGKSEIMAVPDVVKFDFTVEENGATVATAQEKATTKINKALDAVKAAGIEDKDVKTTSYTINPRYEYVQGVCNGMTCTPSRQVPAGYDVRQTIQITVRDTTKAGELFSTVGSLGVSYIGNFAFSIDSIDELKEQARSEAIADARRQAEELAKDLGVKLVRITSYYENNYEPYPYNYYGGDMRAMAESAAAPQVPAGEEKVTSQVTVTYEIR